MTISVPLEKLERLRDTLSEWSPDRVVASEEELRSLIGRLLHSCEVVRPGKYFVRRMLIQVGLPPVRAWSATNHASHTRAASSPRIHLGPEFHADASFGRLLVAGGLGSPAGRLSTPLYRSFLQPPTFTFEVRRLGRCHGGYFLGPEPGSGVWWRFEFDDDVRARLRATVGDWNDLSINVLELLGMVVTAWIFITQSEARPSYARDAILMRGHNMSAVQWVSNAERGGNPDQGRSCAC